MFCTRARKPCILHSGSDQSKNPIDS